MLIVCISIYGIYCILVVFCGYIEIVFVCCCLLVMRFASLTFGVVDSIANTHIHTNTLLTTSHVCFDCKVSVCIGHRMGVCPVSCDKVYCIWLIVVDGTHT